MSQEGQTQGKPQREPVFLLPASMMGLIAVMAVIHFVSTVLLNQHDYVQFLNWFAFQPLRLVVASQDWTLGLPLVWTIFTHALLHGGWDHLLVNVAWLAIFGTPVARRYGGGAMLVIFFVSAAVGAALFAATSLYTNSYLIGASGGVAGLTGAAVRFIFQPVIVAQHPETGERVMLGRHLASFSELMRDNRARLFTLIWVVLNAAVPFLPLVTGQEISVAWQAHLGGFFAGILMVGLFERKGR